MTTSVDRAGMFSFFTGFTVYRYAIGVPLDVVTKRQIVDHVSLLDVIRTIQLKDLGRGAWPNGFKYFTSSYLQLGSTYVVSNLTPEKLSPAARGFMIGLGTSVIEAGVKNATNSLVTRQVQGDRLRDLIKEGPAILIKGLTPALLHRAFSSCIYWSLYEPLHQRYPQNTFAVGLGVGMIQVCTTSPFYVAAVLSQAKPGTIPPQKSLIALFNFILKNGYVTRGIAPRLVHSALTSGPLMVLLERYKVIHR